MWDLPGPGLQPKSLALAGGFLTTAPPGKSPVLLLNVSQIKYVRSQIDKKYCNDTIRQDFEEEKNLGSSWETLTLVAPSLPTNCKLFISLNFNSLSSQM